MMRKREHFRRVLHTGSGRSGYGCSFRGEHHRRMSGTNERQTGSRLMRFVDVSQTHDVKWATSMSMSGVW